jgi:thiosulfate/3-mercaptopyruvate sulfurtransferase
MIVGLLLATALTADPAYPRPDLLLEPAELAKPEVAKQFIVLDVRPKARYQAGHVPGALSVDPATWARAFQDGRDGVDWGKRLGGLGIATVTKVAVYDDSFAKDAARVWWILRYWGVADVRLLNGGLPAWKAAGLPLSTEDAPAPAQVSVPLQPAANRLARQADVLEMVRQKAGQLVDARSEGEFCGTAETAKRNGAIPGAKHLEWSDLLDPKSQRFKPAPEIQQLFQDAGIDPAKPATTYCQSGGRASVMAFALELMGAKDVRNYYASWAEWGNREDTPIEPGKKAEKK